jgi:hypothetical protein
VLFQHILMRANSGTSEVTYSHMITRIFYAQQIGT